MKSKALYLSALLSCLPTTVLAGQALTWSHDHFYFNGREVPPGRYGNELQSYVEAGNIIVLDVALRPPGLYLVYASKATRRLPLHRCGAGTEDHLLLLKYRSGRLSLLDKISVQSCENAVMLVGADRELPSEPASALVATHNGIEFNVLEAFAPRGIEEKQRLRYRIVRGRFVPW